MSKKREEKERKHDPKNKNNTSECERVSERERERERERDQRIARPLSKNQIRRRKKEKPITKEDYQILIKQNII